jgi:hypothetical protein
METVKSYTGSYYDHKTGQVVMLDQNRINRLMEASNHLRSGVGKGINGHFDACLMNAANWLIGGDSSSDKPDCVDLVIREFGMRLNDAGQFSAWRDELKPFAIKVLGTAQGPSLTQKREFMCIDWAIRVIAPMAFDAWAEEDNKNRTKAQQYAAALRAVSPIKDAASAALGRKAAQSARAYAYAYAYAYAAAYRAAAYRAAAAVAAAADVAADVADVAAVAAAADVAAVAAADVAARRKIWEESLRFLQRLIDASL